MKKVYITIEREDLLKKSDRALHNIFYFPSEKMKNISFNKVSIIHFIYTEKVEQDELELLQEIFDFIKSNIVIITVHQKRFEQFKKFIHLELDGAIGYNVEYINVPIVKTMQAQKDIFQYLPDLETDYGAIISAFHKQGRLYSRKKLDIIFPYNFNNNN